MKLFLKYSTPLLAGVFALSSACYASDDVAPLDLSLCFYQVTGDASNPIVENNLYILNLGQASLFRENTQNSVAVKSVSPAIASSNIGADLQAAFGEDWAESGTVYWFVIGTNATVARTTISGDTWSTNYYSRDRASFSTGATGPGTTIDSLNSSYRLLLRNRIDTDNAGTNDSINLVGTNTSTSGVNTSGVIIPKTNAKTFDEHLPPTAQDHFATGIDPRQRFNAGTIAGTAGLEGALDLYRILHSTTGPDSVAADLTAGASSGNAELGVGQFIGTLTIDTAGNLKIQGVGPSAPAGSYASWATTNNVTGGTTGDSDKDGISNLVEYALALNPTAADGAPGTFANGTVSFTKRAEAVTNNDVEYAIQESDDLGISDPWETVVPTANTASVITYTLPSGSQKKFARLVVRKVP